MSSSSATIATQRRTANNGRAPAELERWLHIFAASVREALETEPLRRVAGQRLSLSQFQLLRLVSRVGLNHAGTAARFLGVSQPALTKSTDKLVRLGLVRREPSASDRRALLLRATRRGQTLVARHERMSASRLQRALRGLSAAESAALAVLLRTLSLELLRESDVQDGNCLRCAGYVSDDCAVAHLRGGCPYHVTRAREVRHTSR